VLSLVGSCTPDLAFRTIPVGAKSTDQQKQPAIKHENLENPGLSFLSAILGKTEASLEPY